MAEHRPPGIPTADATAHTTADAITSPNADPTSTAERGPDLLLELDAGPDRLPRTGEPPASHLHPDAGWYHDDYGVIRWWNGAEWDVGAPPAAPGAYGPPEAYGRPEAYGPPGGYPPPAYPPPSYPPPAYPPPGPYPYPGGYPAYGAGVVTENRSLALLAHLGAFIGGFILPLVLMLTAGKTDPFVRYHSTEALNFQLTYLGIALGGVILSIATLGFGLLLFLPLLMIAAVVHIVFAIQGCIAANRGEWYRYPISIRFVKFA